MSTEEQKDPQGSATEQNESAPQASTDAEQQEDVLNFDQMAWANEEPVATTQSLENEIAALKIKRQALTTFTTSGFKYIEGARPWVHVGKVDVALPSATQNEVSKEEAEALVAAGVIAIAEGSNMGCTQEAIDVFEAERGSKGDKAIWYAPGKAANCGGVAVSGLEMAQNSQRLTWTSEEVDEKLKGIMKAAFDNALKTAEEYVTAKQGELPSLVAGSNIAGFVKVAQAMHDQGDWWTQ